MVAIPPVQEFGSSRYVSKGPSGGDCHEMIASAGVHTAVKGGQCGIHYASVFMRFHAFQFSGVLHSSVVLVYMFSCCVTVISRQFRQCCTPSCYVVVVTCCNSHYNKLLFLSLEVVETSQRNTANATRVLHGCYPTIDCYNSSPGQNCCASPNRLKIAKQKRNKEG